MIISCEERLFSLRFCSNKFSTWSILKPKTIQLPGNFDRKDRGYVATNIFEKLQDVHLLLKAEIFFN